MKTLRIIERTILIRTGRNFYKQQRQITITYGNDYKAENHYEDINNPRLKVKFKETFKTRSKARLQEYIDRLGKTGAEQWLKQQLLKVMEENQYEQK